MRYVPPLSCSVHSSGLKFRGYGYLYTGCVPHGREDGVRDFYGDFLFCPDLSIGGGARRLLASMATNSKHASDALSIYSRSFFERVKFKLAAGFLFSMAAFILLGFCSSAGEYFIFISILNILRLLAVTNYVASRSYGNLRFLKRRIICRR